MKQGQPVLFTSVFVVFTEPETIKYTVHIDGEQMDVWMHEWMNDTHN